MISSALIDSVCIAEIAIWQNENMLLITILTTFHDQNVQHIISFMSVDNLGKLEANREHRSYRQYCFKVLAWKFSSTHYSAQKKNCFVVYNKLCLFPITAMLFRAQEPKAPVTYCDHALFVVCRPSSVRLFTFSTSSPEPLDGFWWNLVWMKYSRSLTSVVVFRPDLSRGGSRAEQK